MGDDTISFQPSALGLAKEDGLPLTCALSGCAFRDLQGGAVGLTKVAWLQSAVGPPGDLLHKAGGQRRSGLHEKGAGQLHPDALTGAVQCGINSVQERSHSRVCEKGVL